MSDLVRLPRYRSFSDLPNHIRLQVQRWGEADVERWVQQQIPALDHRSIVETMNLPDGEQKVLEFFRDLRGMLT
jgi:hypothetical protein